MKNGLGARFFLGVSNSDLSRRSRFRNDLLGVFSGASSGQPSSRWALTRARSTDLPQTGQDTMFGVIKVVTIEPGGHGYVDNGGVLCFGWKRANMAGRQVVRSE